MITPETLAQWDAVCSASTPGPWKCSWRGDGSGSVHPGTDEDYDVDATLVEDYGALANAATWLRGEIRYEDGVLCALARTALPEAIRELRECYSTFATYQSAVTELLELLREAWNCQYANALTLFLTALVGGIRTEWLKAMPENGFVCATAFPDVGKVEIAIRRIDGKSTAETMRELQADNGRQKAEIQRLHLLLEAKQSAWRNSIACVLANPAEIELIGTPPHLEIREALQPVAALQAEVDRLNVQLHKLRDDGSDGRSWEQSLGFAHHKQPEDTFAAGTDWQKEGK